MKILRESRSQLCFKQQPNLAIVVFMLIWGSFFVGIPLVIMTLFARDLGVTQLRCDRLEPAWVDCQRQRSQFFGLVEQPAQTFRNVIAVQQRSETGRDSDGAVTYDHWVTITTNQGEQILVQETTRINGVRGNLADMQAIAGRMKTFLDQTNQPSLTFEIDNRWGFGPLGIFAFLGLFPTIGAFSFYSIFQREELIFDRELGQFQRQRQTLLGPRYQELPLHSITGLDIQTCRSNKSTYYQLNLLPTTLDRRTLMSSTSRAQVVEIQQKIQQFLRLPQLE